MEWVFGFVLLAMLFAGAFKSPLHRDEVDPKATLEGMSSGTEWAVYKVFQSGRTEPVGLFTGSKHAVAAEIAKRCARGRLAGQSFEPVLEHSADGKWMRARKPLYDGRGSSEGRKVFAYEARLHEASSSI